MFKKCVRKKYKTVQACNNACFRLGIRLNSRYSPMFCEVCNNYHITKHK